MCEEKLCCSFEFVLYCDCWFYTIFICSLKSRHLQCKPNAKRNSIAAIGAWCRVRGVWYVDNVAPDYLPWRLGAAPGHLHVAPGEWWCEARGT